MGRRFSPALRVLGCLTVAFSSLAFGQSETTVIDGITFADEPGVMYAPIKDIGYRVGWSMTSDKKTFLVENRPVTIPRTLPDGTRLIPVRNLVHLGLQLAPSEDGSEFTVTGGAQELMIRKGEKRVVINKKEQKLRCYQGDRVVIETRVSTGRRGFTTPNGTWTAGPEKARLRFSKKYENAPMPWAVQINGGYFMHGYTSVPRRPASHGCVRLPLWGINPAKWIWHWIDLGTPITIANNWQDDGDMASVTTAPKAKGPETIPVDTKNH